MKLKISRNRFWVELIAILLLFSGIISRYINAFQYLDEVVSIVCIGALAVSRQKNTTKYFFLSLFLSIVLLILGLISTLQAEIQLNIKAIVLDILAIFKFLPVFWGGLIISDYIEHKQRVWSLLSKISRVFILFAFICAVVNLFVDINMYTDIRYGLRAFNFIYTRVGGLYMGCSIMLMIQVVDIYYMGISKKKEIFLWLTLIVMCSTLRIRAFSFAAFFLVGYFVIVKNKKFKKINIGFIILLAVVVITISFNQIQYYFFESETEARNILLKYGIKTALTFFPLGAGYAAYGTNMAKTYYSSLYSQYGFQNYYGLGRVKSTYLTDTYWPAIIGEFGFFGAVIMAFIIGAIIVYTYKKTRHNKILLFAVMYEFGVIVLSSFATASFITSTAAIFLIALAISEHEDANQQNSIWDALEK